MTSCKKNMSFQECELAILRQAVDKADVIEGEKLLKDPEVKKIIDIVENFCAFAKEFATEVLLLMLFFHLKTNSMI